MNAIDPFEEIVTAYYQPLYRFALSLTRAEFDARDLTQQTFYVWATKGHQLRDFSKVKTWLFTTLHRLFLEGHRRKTKFPHVDLEEVSNELPDLSPDLCDQLDSGHVLSALARVDEIFQAAVALFYLKDFSYKEIAAILEVPIGTVKSRIARGLAQLRQILLSGAYRESTSAKRTISSGFARQEAVEPKETLHARRFQLKWTSRGQKSHDERDFSSTLIWELVCAE